MSNVRQSVDTTTLKAGDHVTIVGGTFPELHGQHAVITRKLDGMDQVFAEMLFGITDRVSYEVKLDNGDLGPVGSSWIVAE
jgi:hypothetical protein